MPADSDSDPIPDLDAAARRVPEDAKQDPIPGKLIKLAERLESLLALQNRPKDPN